MVTLDGSARVVLVPRMRFTFRLKYGASWQLTRTQYPLRLAYAMSVNKSQGQTLGRVVADSTDESFAHGQTYVCKSRVSDRKNLMMYILSSQLVESNNEGDPEGTLWPTMTNVVYKGVLKFI